MKRVLITGAAGFVGRALVRDLQQRSWSVVAAGRAPIADLPEGVTFRLIPDLATDFDWSPYVAEVDHVVHLAGLVHVRGRAAWKDYERINVAATRRLATAAALSGIRRFLFVSSIYAQTGPAADHVITESDAPRPVNDYGRSKLEAERAVEASGVLFTIVRPTVVYGPGAPGNVRTLLRLAELRVPLPIASLQGRRSLVALENLTEGVSFLLGSDDAVGQTYVISDGSALTPGEMIAALRAGMGRRPNLFHMSPRILGYALRLIRQSEISERLTSPLIVNPDKLKKIGWLPRKSTRDGLMAMAAARRS